MVRKGLWGWGAPPHPCGGCQQAQFCSVLEGQEPGKAIKSLIHTATFLEVEGYFVLFNQLRDIEKINISKVCVGMHSYVHHSRGLLKHSRGSNSAEVMGQIPNRSVFILLHLDPICSVLKHPRHGNRRERPRSLCRAVWSLSFSDWLLRRWNLQG